MIRERVRLRRPLVSLVHGEVAPAGAVGAVSSYAQSGHDSRWSVVFDPGQGVRPSYNAPDGWQTFNWPVDPVDLELLPPPFVPELNRHIPETL